MRAPPKAGGPFAMTSCNHLAPMISLNTRHQSRHARPCGKREPQQARGGKGYSRCGAAGNLSFRRRSVRKTATLPPGPACDNIKARDAGSRSRNSVSKALWPATVQAACCHPLTISLHSRGFSSSADPSARASQSSTTKPTAGHAWPAAGSVNSCNREAKSRGCRSPITGSESVQDPRCAAWAVVAAGRKPKPPKRRGN